MWINVKLNLNHFGQMIRNACESLLVVSQIIRAIGYGL